jgi:SAM-dependent methyltransferase
VSTVRVTPEIELQYGCELARLPEALRRRFIALAHDDAARAFVDAARAAPHGVLRTWLYGTLRSLLSDYDAYGLLDMYPMHLLSAAQLDRLLGTSPRARLLDIGAGSGGVTAHAAELFAHVSAIETSSVLRRKLRARGFEVIEHDLTYSALPARHAPYDVVTCFNVIDRCSHPLTLLRHAIAALRPGGTLIASVPLPLKPHVHVGRFTVDQEERLPAAEETWEAGAATLAAELLAPLGLEVTALSRAPYLCRGDASTPLYVLDAAIFVCRERRS